jgi:hypothetical protein
MNATMTLRRCFGLLLAVGLVGLGAGCNGLESPTNADPAVRALGSPEVPVAPTAPGDPTLPATAWERAVGLAPGVLIPRDVVLPYPPEVRETILAKWGNRNLLRDATPSTVFLNFEGVNIVYANYDSDARTNTSWIPGHNVTIPAFNASHWGSNRSSVISNIVTDLQQVNAGYNVTFTTTRPASGNYMMTVIGGSAALIGMQQGVLGVSPLDCDNTNPVDVNFICTEDIAAYNMSLWSLVFTIAHENAHTYGLAHINRQGDIMYWAEDGSASLTWGAATTRAGETDCSSNGYQDDRLFLTANVGGGGVNPETTPPTVAITSPANNSSQPTSFQITVTATDASSVTSVELWKDGAMYDSTWTTPYTFTMLPQPTGSHTLQAKAVDLYNNIGSSATVTFTVPAGPTPGSCTTDAQCAANQKCQGGTCVDKPPAPTGGALGANCSANTDCISTWCIFGEQNYCTQPCNEAQNIFCPAGYYCSPDGFCLTSTPIPPGATGAPCKQNVECRSQICVDGANNGYCTAVCQQNGNPCPNDSKCVDSGDGQTYICARPPTTNDGGTHETGSGSGGCAAAPTAPGAGLAGIVLALLLGAPRRRGRGR